MLTYLLIAFIIAVALAPLVHFMPSKRQRELSRLREYAALHGLFVELRPLPGGDRAPRPPPGEVIYYGLRLPATADLPRGAWALREEGWRGIGARLPVPAAFAGFPAEVFVASCDSGSCGAFWVESGGEQKVEQIRAALCAWAGQGAS